MKENLKIRVITEKDRLEAHDLFKSIGCKGYCIRIGEGDFITQNMIEITLPELRELARPKEYLNDKFELVVTNQPDDGWLLVPDGANRYTRAINGHETFWDNDNSILIHGGYGDMSGRYTFGYYVEHYKAKILWQRENKVETVKGRFLHQWAYEAFGRGEDLQHTPCERDCDWTSTSIASPISIFNAREMKFRLKPQTIQIGSRTITKPIGVKPENGQTYFIVDLMNKLKYRTNVWRGTDLDIYQFNSGLCHLTAQDSINCADALLELMK